jgi:hypothetical protein
VSALITAPIRRTHFHGTEPDPKEIMLSSHIRPGTDSVGLLAEHAEDLGEPYTRHLGGKVRELRFHLLSQQTRVTYWLAPQRRVILLTVFRKTRSAEIAEVARATQAQKICESTHSIAHESFDREVT